MTVIYSSSPFETPEIADLRESINEADRDFAQQKIEHDRQQRELCARYDDMLAKQRPVYPKAEQLNALDRIADFIESDTPYGNHLGYATEQDKAAGRTLPGSVQFASRSHRINIYTHAPYAAGSSRRLWSFSEDELDAIRNKLQERSLRIVSEWNHEDGTAFVVTSAKV